MLTRLEKNPRALFEEWELKRQDPAGFEDAMRTGLVRRLPAPRLGDSYVDPSGRLRTVVANPDGTLEAIDEDDPECDPVPVTLSEVASWTVNVDLLCQRFREVNILSGDFGRLHERLHLLGDLSPDRAIVLAFLLDERSGVPLLMTLPALAPTTIREFIVVVPSLTPSPPEQRRLEALHIWVRALRSDDPFAVRGLATSIPSVEVGRADVGFHHSDDFRSVSVGGRRFTLTPRQAEVVQILYRAHCNRTPEVGWPYIRAELSTRIDSYPERLTDIFKRSDAWGKLIVPGKTRGSYRLSL